MGVNRVTEQFQLRKCIDTTTLSNQRYTRLGLHLNKINKSALSKMIAKSIIMLYRFNRRV